MQEQVQVRLMHKSELRLWCNLLKHHFVNFGGNLNICAFHDLLRSWLPHTKMIRQNYNNYTYKYIHKYSQIMSKIWPYFRD